MKNLEKELLELGQSWNLSGEYDGTEFEGRLFVGDLELDIFTIKHNLGRSDDGGGYDPEKIESACNCKIVCDYEGANKNRQFGDQEIIFKTQR